MYSSGMEPVRDINHHLVCCVDSERGLIEHIHQKEMVRICLPVGGEVLIIRQDNYTLIRRIGPRSFFVDNHYQHGLASLSG